MSTLKTRSVLVAASVIAVAGLSGCQSHPVQTQGDAPTIIKAAPASFYARGVFQADTAKAAYFELMASFNYPVSNHLKTDEFWVCDFLQTDFRTVGMGGIFWINRKGVYGEAGARQYKGKSKEESFGYLGHEIFVLSHQALPEHRHVGGEQGFGPKMESWHVRYGTVEFFSEFKAPDGDETLISDMPAAERPWGYGQPWFKSKYVATRKAGELYHLGDPESWHFLRGGRDGAIVSEYATYHNQVEFSKPGMEFKNSGAK